MDSAGPQAQGTEPAGDCLRQAGLHINESLDSTRRCGPRWTELRTSRWEVPPLVAMSLSQAVVRRESFPKSTGKLTSQKNGSG